MQKLENSIRQMEDRGMTGDPRYRIVKQLHQSLLKQQVESESPRGPAGCSSINSGVREVRDSSALISFVSFEPR